MESDSDDHAFIVRLYRTEDGTLRGHITHAYSRRRDRLHRPEDVLDFMTPYLHAMGVHLSLRSRLILRLSRRAPGASDVPALPDAHG